MGISFFIWFAYILTMKFDDDYLVRLTIVKLQLARRGMREIELADATGIPIGMIRLSFDWLREMPEEMLDSAEEYFRKKSK